MNRILHIGMSDTLGGIEVFIMNLYRNIDKTKMQFDFIKFSDTIPFEDEILNLGGRVFRITSRRENFVKNRKEMSKFLLEHPEFEIVHYHINSCSYIEPAIISKKMNRKVIIHSHNSGLNDKILTKILHSYNRKRLHKYVDLKLACSKEAAEFMYDNLDDKAYIVPNAIDGEKFRFNFENRIEVRREFDIGEEILLGTVGRLTKQKNHKFMLEIMSNLVKMRPNSKLMIAGDGVLKDDLIKLSDELGISNNIVFLGTIKNPERYLNAIDLFLMPSFYEGLSISALEAHASGLVVLASEFVPTDTYIPNLVKKISLNESAYIWAKEIDTMVLPQRSEFWNEFEKSQYNIKNSLDKIEKIYVKHI